MWSPTCAFLISPFGSTSFQSTGSVWSPTFRLNSLMYLLLYFNPRAPCGARHYYRCTWILHDISIHGLRVEPDPFVFAQLSKSSLISIHGLRVEPDPLIRWFVKRLFKFQSTGSVWSPTANLYKFDDYLCTDLLKSYFEKIESFTCAIKYQVVLYYISKNSVRILGIYMITSVSH